MVGPWETCIRYFKSSYCQSRDMFLFRLHSDKDRNLSSLQPTPIASHGHLARSMFQDLPRLSLKADIRTLTTTRLLAVKQVASIAILFLGKRLRNTIRTLVFPGLFSKMQITLMTIHSLGLLNSRMLSLGRHSATRASSVAASMNSTLYVEILNPLFPDSL